MSLSERQKIDARYQKRGGCSVNKKKYVAYVGTYVHGSSKGLNVYDVDVENGRFTLKDRVEITNSSYLTISHNRKWLYSITDLVWNPMKF